MAVSADYIADLVAKLDADKEERDALLVPYIEEFDDCSQCGESIDDSFGCYFCD